MEDIWLESVSKRIFRSYFRRTFRVDVMTFNYKLVVNEFESLEADYHAKEDERTFMMDSSLKLYWKNKLFQMIQMHHQSL